mgnify:CR=1 FL=1
MAHIGCRFGNRVLFDKQEDRNRLKYFQHLWFGGNLRTPPISTTSTVFVSYTVQVRKCNREAV